MTTVKPHVKPPQSHSCGVCRDIFDLLEMASQTPWSPEERVAVLARSAASGAEAERVLRPRGYNRDRFGRWSLDRQ